MGRALALAFFILYKSVRVIEYQRFYTCCSVDAGQDLDIRGKTGANDRLGELAIDDLKLSDPFSQTITAYSDRDAWVFLPEVNLAPPMGPAISTVGLYVEIVGTLPWYNGPHNASPVYPSQSAVARNSLLSLFHSQAYTDGMSGQVLTLAPTQIIQLSFVHLRIPLSKFRACDFYRQLLD